MWQSTEKFLFLSRRPSSVDHIYGCPCCFFRFVCDAQHKLVAHIQAASFSWAEIFVGC
jgi:hypothetical protein